MQNVYCKKATDLTVVNDVRPTRQAICRPENKDVDKMLAESVERNSSYFNTRIESFSGALSDVKAKSLLRQRSIKSMLKNRRMNGVAGAPVVSRHGDSIG